MDVQKHSNCIYIPSSQIFYLILQSCWYTIKLKIVKIKIHNLYWLCNSWVLCNISVLLIINLSRSKKYILIKGSVWYFLHKSLHDSFLSTWHDFNVICKSTFSFIKRFIQYVIMNVMTEWKHAQSLLFVVFYNLHITGALQWHVVLNLQRIKSTWLYCHIIIFPSIRHTKTCYGYYKIIFP
jgi:hypothetical protein